MQIDFTRVTFRYTFITVLWPLCKKVLSLMWDGLGESGFLLWFQKVELYLQTNQKSIIVFLFFLFGCQWVCQVWIFSPQGYCKIYHWQIYKSELLPTGAFYNLKAYFKKYLQNWFKATKISLCVILIVRHITLTIQIHSI